jgi:LmbE family N-acetylglucosaminyl deacetylase
MQKNKPAHIVYLSALRTTLALAFCFSFATSFHMIYAARPTSCPNGTSLNVVAHEDDDLLFINPSIQGDIRAGKCVITVYMTAGDANNGSAYWLGRENGEKAAYAQMAGSSNSWTQYDAGVPNHPIPLFNLNSASSISLLFMRLPDGNSSGVGFPNYNYESLLKLWNGDIATIHTVDTSSSYSRQAVIDTVAFLMNTYAPDQINTQNYFDPMNFSIDHSDHYVTAHITQEANTQYIALHTFTGYYDYEISSRPVNLSNADATEKQNSFLTYSPYDPAVCQTVSECQITRYADWWTRQYAYGTPLPTMTPTPTPGASTELITNGSWIISGNNGSGEKDTPIPSSSLNGKTSAEITFDLHGARFGRGDDEASVIFIQGNEWYVINLTVYGQNQFNGSQTVTVPLTDFHRVGNGSLRLDTTRPVSNLHARFWNSGSFTVEVGSVKVQN